jgi:cyanophycin synthetase
VAALVELRVLDGPNLYFPRAAVQLSLDVSPLVDAAESEVRLVGRALGTGRLRAYPAGTAFRQRAVARLVARLVRRLALGAGTSRLAVRVRPAADVRHVVVAFPWRRRGTAVALGEAVAAVLDELPAGDVDRLVAEHALAVRSAEPGGAPATLRPTVPVVAVTGTNGKTTTSRLVAHMGRCAGRVVGWSNTDGVYVDGVQVEEGDYSGPAGARTVLADPRVQLAVTETARGGILLRSMGIATTDVSVVTNVSADHLGMMGIDTLDQLAEVKAVLTRVTRPGGWVVLNADDPRTYAMRRGARARPWVFSRRPDAPQLREVLADHGRATTVLDGQVAVILPGRDPDPLVALVDVPCTLAGLSGHNVENALAAASAGLAVGLDRAAVVEGLRTFAPGPEHNPGRMNVYTLAVAGGELTVVLDLAHNEAGLEALLEIMRGLRPPGGRLLLGLGTAGDRSDDVLVSLGELAARGADVVRVVHKERYLRGRSVEEMDRLFRAGGAAVGVTGWQSSPTELAGLEALLSLARPGDVVALMCHADRVQLDARLRAGGGSADDPATLRAKVLAAAGSPA